MQKFSPNLLAQSMIFLIFATKVAKILRLGTKKNKFFCFALDFPYHCKIESNKKQLHYVITTRPKATRPEGHQ